MTLPDFLAVAVVLVAVPLNLFVTGLLLRLSWSAPNTLVLRAQALAWVSLTIIVTVFAVVFVNNGLDEPPLDSTATMLLTRGTLLVFSVLPAAYWLHVVWRRL